MRLQIAERIGRILLPGLWGLCLLSVPIVLMGDLSRLGGPIIGLLGAAAATAVARRGRWLVAVNVALLLIVVSAIAESAMQGFSAPSTWTPLIALPIAVTLHWLRGGLAIVGASVVVACTAWWAESSGVVVRQEALPAQLALTVPLFTAVGGLLMIAPVGLLSRTLADSEARRLEVERAESRFRAMFEQSSSLVLLLDARGCVTALNAAAEALFGDDLPVGAHLTALPAWSDAQRAQLEAVLEQARAGVPVRFELVSDAQRTYAGHATPWSTGQAEGQGIVVDLDDVTRLVEARRRLAHASRLEALGQLAGGVAHDFNNMLTIIQSASELLATEPAVTADPELAELVQTIEEAATSSAALTRQLLTFGRRDAAGLVEVDVSVLVADAARLLQRTLRPGVRLEVEASAAGGVQGDVAALESAIVNLGANARDAMPDGGVLTLSARVCYLDEEGAAALHPALPAGPTLALCVADTGSGIPPEIRPLIFEPFFTTKGPSRGTGLGLAAVQTTILRHGGHIDVQSTVGGGTAFTIYLPMTRHLSPAASSSGAS